MISSPILVPPDLDKEFFLWVDASEDGFGAILEQNGEDSLQHPVAYASRATNEAEKNILLLNWRWQWLHLHFKCI